LVTVFREVRRVLRADGTVWINLGDTYAQSGGPGWQGKNGQRADRRFTLVRDTVPMRAAQRGAPAGLKPKDLVGVPWRVAFALQVDGWYLRQDIIWSKPNPMPESVRDRCTKAHEYIFLLSKSERYYFDQEAIVEDASPNTHSRVSQDLEAQIGSSRAHGGTKVMKAVARSRPSGWHNSAYWKDGKAAPGMLEKTRNRERCRKAAKEGMGIKNNGSMDAALSVMPLKRNKRSVWIVGSKPFSEAHFATYPPELIEPCILAGSPAGGLVLDPFGGAGTTGLVADRLGRDAILCELNSDYAEMARKRISTDGGLFAKIEVAS
jgi:DNA modification methylase